MDRPFAQPFFTRFLQLAGVLLAAAVLAACARSRADQAPASPPAPQVTASEVLVREVRDWADFTGRLEAVEHVEVRARVAGYVESVHFDEGGRVEAGDLLFRIDPRPFRAEAERLAAELERAQAELELARSNHARAERLFAQNATSREELESLAAGAAVAEARRAAVAAALDAAELELSFTDVTAPISGRVSSALVTAGNLIDGSELLTTVVSDDPVYAYFDVDEQTYLEHVRETNGDEAAVYVGLINEEGFPHRARLDFVDNHVDPRHGTIRARAVLDNADGTFTPGLFTRLRLVGSRAYRAALIDERAIGTDLGRKFVLVLDEESVAQYRPIEIGPRVASLRVVRSGLDAGDVVIVNGLQRVRPGAPVAATRVASGGTESLERFVVQLDPDLHAHAH